VVEAGCGGGDGDSGGGGGGDRNGRSGGGGGVGVGVGGGEAGTAEAAAAVTGALHVCCGCERMLRRCEFSGSQWKKNRAGQRRCVRCSMGTVT